MIVVLSEIPSRQASINAQESRAITEAARLFGCRVYSIPAAFDECETAENALAYVPHFDDSVPGIWVGVIPDYERYVAIYHAAKKKNVLLLNTPEQHRTAMEFDQFYPFLKDLTPKSVVIDDFEKISTVTDDLAFPVFVKGAIKSNKDAGWSSVVAQNMDELVELGSVILSRKHRSRGKIIVRELIDLNTVAVDPNGFPIGREYRAFLYKGEVLAYGFYWDEYDDSLPLTDSEKQQIFTLLKETARRIDVPFISVDIGQRRNGDWVLIEIGDGQFSGLSKIPVLELWSKIKDLQL